MHTHEMFRLSRFFDIFYRILEIIVLNNTRRMHNVTLIARLTIEYYVQDVLPVMDNIL